MTNCMKCDGDLSRLGSLIYRKLGVLLLFCLPKFAKICVIHYAVTEFSYKPSNLPPRLLIFLKQSSYLDNPKQKTKKTKAKQRSRKR